MTEKIIATAPAISDLERAARAAKGGPDSWNPPFCGDLDMRIAADGTWYYLGSPIGRKPLVKLFSSVLRREADGRTYLVTPVEKVGIKVDDAAFVAVEMTVMGAGESRLLTFRTQTDEWVAAGPDHPLRFALGDDGALKPYLFMRRRLEALIVRAVYYDLVELGVEHGIGAETYFGVWSGGMFFPMAPAGALQAL